MQASDIIDEMSAAARDVVSVARLASPWQRLVASFIDSLVFGVVLVAAYYAAQSAGVAVPDEQAINLMSPEASFVATFGILLAINLHPLYGTGQTWGKRLVGIAVVDLKGRRVPLWRQALRLMLLCAFAASSGFLFGILHFANLLTIFAVEHRCGHDFISGTKVVDLR